VSDSRLPAGARLAARAEKIEMWAGSVAFYAEVSDAELAELRAQDWDAVRSEGVVLVHPRERDEPKGEHHSDCTAYEWGPCNCHLYGG
jgi:hypothetical protein